MDKNDRLTLYDEAITKWGAEAQREMAYEELGELITAIAQYRRGRVGRKEVITELADVTIMCEQLAYMLGYEDYENEIDEKLIRLRDKKLHKNE